MNAVKTQFADRRLTMACMELHAVVLPGFLPQYAGCMEQADMAFVYYNPEVIQHKRLKEIDPEQVKNAFGGNNSQEFLQSRKLCKPNYEA